MRCSPGRFKMLWAWFEQAGGGVGGGRASPPCAMVATSKVLMAVESWCCNLLF